MNLMDTLSYIELFATSFAKQLEVLKDLEMNYSAEVNELLSSETLQRYKSNVKALKFPYRNYISELGEAPFEEGFLIQSWSSMGSILESTLQMFLAIYYRDYINSRDNLWDENVIEKIKETIKVDVNNSLKELVADNDIKFSGEDRKSFIKKIERIINEKKILVPIEKLTLEPLIAFYVSNNIIATGNYSEVELRLIRDNRNSIHSFQKREIGNWDELNYYGKVLLMLLMDIHYRLPDLPDEIPLSTELYEIHTQLIMLEQQWFEYTLSG